ncbi:unnamed protein product, partial [Porites evermanni]
FTLKFYFILQISFWVHCFPELYFMRAKREEIFPKIQLYIEYLLFIWAAYMLNFTHITICCLVVHYFVECINHAMRMLRISGKEDVAKTFFWVWTFLFAIARFAIIALTFMTFWYELSYLCLDVELSDQCIINFVIRLTAMAGVILMQAWLAWNFICYQIRMWREYAASTATPSKKKDNKKKSKKESEKKKKEEVVAED